MVRTALWKAQRVAEPYLLAFAHLVERGIERVPAPPEVTAKAVCVIDADTRALIFAKNARLRFPPASLTKLATAMLFERASDGRWDEEVDVLPEDIITGSTMGLIPGDKVSRRDLLLGMLVPSGNDAAAVAARLIGPRWRDDLNRLAAGLGMGRTQFVNPHGRDAPGHVSNARDLARLAATAFSVPLIREAAGMHGCQIRIGGAHERTQTLVSTLKMLDEPNVIAGKTGSSYKARGCLALLVEKAGRRAVIVITGSTVAFGPSGVVETSDRRYDDARAIVAKL